MEKIDMLRELIRRCVLDRGMYFSQISVEVMRAQEKIDYCLFLHGIDLDDFVQEEMAKHQRPESEQETDDEAPLLPADRQDMIVDFLERHAGQVFRREELQELSGFTKSQIQRDLKQLKEDNRIGYREERVKLPNAKNPRVPFWRNDAVYFALTEETKPEWTFPIILKNEDEVEEFIRTWKNT